MVSEAWGLVWRGGSAGVLVGALAVLWTSSTEGVVCESAFAGVLVGDNGSHRFDMEAPGAGTQCKRNINSFLPSLQHSMNALTSALINSDKTGAQNRQFILQFPPQFSRSFPLSFQL